MSFIIRSSLGKASSPPSALATNWLPRGAAPNVCIGREYSLITSISIHDPVSDSFATRPVAGKHDLAAVGRPGRLIAIDTRRLVGELFSIAAVGIHHPNISAPVRHAGPERNLCPVGGPRGGIAVRVPVPVWSRQAESGGRHQGPSPRLQNGRFAWNKRQSDGHPATRLDRCSQRRYQSW